MLSKLLKLFKKTKAKPIAVQVEEKFERLTNAGNTYSFSGTVPFKSVHTLKPETIEKVFDFAYSMVYTSEGHHRSYRSGGKQKRKNGQKFADTFQGKIAECAACNYFYKYDKTVSPDFSVEGVGEWESCGVCILMTRTV